MIRSEQEKQTKEDLELHQWKMWTIFSELEFVMIQKNNSTTSTS